MKIADVPIFVFDLENNEILDSTPAYKRLGPPKNPIANDIAERIKIHPLNAQKSLVVGFVTYTDEEKPAKAYLQTLTEEEIRILIQELFPSPDLEELP